MPLDGSPRIVALCLPDLPLQREIRGRERAAGSPLAIADGGRIACCNAPATAAGVRPGATLPAALAVCARLTVVPADAAADRAALRGLAEAMLALVPAVELAPPDVLLLDASAAHLVPAASSPTGAAPPPAPGPRGRWMATPEQEIELARRALATAAEMGYVARAAVASGRGPARALARHGERPLAWIDPSCTAAALAALPVTALGLAPGVAARLAALGVEDAGALAALPEGTLAHRFGPEGVLAARLARGEDGSPLVPHLPEALPEESLELEAPAESAEPLLFALKRLADRVAARLAGRGLGASRLKIVLRLDPRGEERAAVPLAAPSAVPARWLLPLKERLLSLRLGAPVIALRLAAIEVAPVAPEQLAIGDRPEVIAALEGVLARLAGRLGEGALFAAEPVDRYRPEGAYRTVPFGPRTRAGRRGPAPEEEPPPRPTRLLSEPRPVVAEGEGGRLTAVRVDGRARAVIAIDGPERLRGEWWGEPFDRDYYRVRLEGVGDCWMYRDGRDGRLYLHGFFD